MRILETSVKKPAYVMYAIGISVWMTLVSCSGSTYMFPLLPSVADNSTYVIAQQFFYVAAFFVTAGAASRFGPLKPHALCHVTAAAFVGAVLVSGAVFLLGHTETYVLVLYGLCVGVGLATGFIQWIRIVAGKPFSEIKSLLFIASFVSVFSSIVFCFVSVEFRVLIFGAVLVPMSLVFLYYNTRLSGVQKPGHAVSRGKDGVRRVFADVAVPLICAIALILIAPIASSAYVDTTGQDLFRQLLAQAANLTALLVLAIIMIGFNRNVRLFGAYCVLLPLLSSSILFAPLLLPDQRWFVLFLGDISFCTVSFLMLLTCCATAKRLDVSVVVVYGFFGGFVYLARFPEIALVLAPKASVIPIESFAIAALLLYILTIPAFFLPYLRKKESGDWKRAMESFTTADVSRACDFLSARNKLSQRQKDVLKLLVTGRDIPHISESLCLSPNTVRTYRKALYASLNVHSKQELLDLIEHTMSVADETC